MWFAAFLLEAPGGGEEADAPYRILYKAEGELPVGGWWMIRVVGCVYLRKGVERARRAFSDVRGGIRSRDVLPPQSPKTNAAKTPASPRLCPAAPSRPLGRAYIRKGLS